MIAILGSVAITRMPVDMFPPINIPVVVVATFYSGMPPEQIEADITSRFERFFTLASGIDHIESRSLPGISLIRVYFQPGFSSDSAVTSISNLAMANLRRLPPGTLPPIILKSDSASLPVCLVTLKGEGMDEARLRDIAQYTVRNQVASVKGASVPQPFGGKTRQIMVYADPYKLESHQLSLMDVVRSVNESNLILPAGDVPIGRLDYNIYTNSQLPSIDEVAQIPVKTVGQASVRVRDVGVARDAAQIQTNVVRVDGQRSVYIPVLKQEGDTSTIAVVDGVREALGKLFDVPKELVSNVVFDQSRFVKTAIRTLLDEGVTGLVLTSVMILVFLGSFRATLSVFFSIPISALAAFLALSLGGGSVNTMVLGGLALAFSRLIDNSVVVLENIYRHLEHGDAPDVAAEKGGREVALPVLAATLTTVVVFFPVTILYGVSKYLFSAMALAVVLSLFASYVVALTVVPLYCANFIRSAGHDSGGFNRWFNRQFQRFLDLYSRMVAWVLRRPRVTLAVFLFTFGASLLLFPLLDVAFFPRSDAAQFVMNVKAPSGTRLSITEGEISRLESLVKEVVSPEDFGMIVSNIGSTPDISAIYTANSAGHTAAVQVSLKPEHKIGSYEYMARMKKRIEQDMPELSVYFQSGDIVDSILNMGLPVPIDLQVAGSNTANTFKTAVELAGKIRRLPGVADAFIPQDLDYPSLELGIDRGRAAELGLNQREVVSNLITALTSNAMIAPSFWIDPKNGNDYMLTVQYPENQIRSLADLRAIPLRAAGNSTPTRLDSITRIRRIKSPTEVDHYQLRRVIDVYVRPLGEDLGRLSSAIDRIVAETKTPPNAVITMRGMVQGMRASFQSFAIGLTLSLLLLYLIMVAQFQSFLDPVIILMAVPPGLMGVLLTLYFTGTSLNVMSLMGIVMLVGISASASILVVEFTKTLRSEGMSVRDALPFACRVRLRPILMTSLATIVGLLPMALKLGEGSESYAPLARAVLGGLSISMFMTVFIVPAAYLLAYGKADERKAQVSK